jgi:general secretion pathway protein D
MTRTDSWARVWLTGTALATLGLSGCQSLRPAHRDVEAVGSVTSAAPAASSSEDEPKADAAVRSTIVRGDPAAAARTAPGSSRVPAHGTIVLNFVSVEVPVVARAVLGDVLGLPYSVDPGIAAQVTLQAPYPVARSEVLPLFEEALKASGYALIKRGSVLVIQPTVNSRGTSTAGAGDFGYGDETLALTYASATEIKRLLDPILPNTLTMADPGRNVVILSGTTAQRRAARDMIRQFDVDWMRGMSFGLIVPQRTDARLIAPELDKLLNSPGSATAGMVRLLPMERLNGIIAITAQPAYLDDVRRWVEILDREGESSQPRLFVYRVQNGKSADLAKVIAAAMGTTAFGSPASTSATPSENPGSASSFPTPQSGNGSQQQSFGNPPTASEATAANAASSPASRPGGMTIGTDEANNAVVVFSTPKDYAVIEDALRKLDVPPLQVMIDAAITEVTLNDKLSYGVQWFLNDGKTQGSLTQGTTSAPTRVFPGLSVLYRNGADITATLNALRDATDIDVISAPKIMVLNNQTASLQVGDQVPVTTSSAISTTNSDAPLVSTVEYRDTGVILKVTPRVNDGGLVLLDIAQEVSDVTTTDSSKIDSPTIQQRRIATTIAVRDGQTIALGGMIRHRRTVGRKRIPLLGDVPVLGQLFGDTVRDGKRTELLVLLTPRVIRSPVDADAVTEELRRRIRSVSPDAGTKK